MDLRDVPAVMPLHFFDVCAKPGLLKGYSEFLDEDPFCEVEIECALKGIDLNLKVNKGFEKAFFPSVEKGDGFELFIDTRGIREAVIVHKYCHHFVFLPKEMDGILGVEVTRFRTNDTHELCAKESLKVVSKLAKDHYTMQIHILRESLFGYDPSEYEILKFAYIVHRGPSEPNHFPKSNNVYNLKDHPSLWAELNLKGVL